MLGGQGLRVFLHGKPIVLPLHCVEVIDQFRKLDFKRDFHIRSPAPPNSQMRKIKGKNARLARDKKNQKGIGGIRTHDLLFTRQAL